MIKSFFSQLNPRQLVIHFVAFWFFIYALDTLASLYDYQFLYHPSAYMEQLVKRDQFNNDILVVNLVGTLGLVIAYIISWRISVQYNWFWANAVIIFLVEFFLKSHNYLGWDVLKTFFLQPGTLLGENSIPCIIVNGLIMLALGCLLLFNKKIILYIDNGVKSEDKKAKLKAAKLAETGTKK